MHGRRRSPVVSTAKRADARPLLPQRLPSMLRPRIAVLILAALALALLAWGWWTARAQPAAPADAPPGAAARSSPAPVPVVLEPVVEMLDDTPLDVVGSGAALRSVALRPAVAGEVARVGFRAGQRVEAGQLLVQLVDRTQRLAVDAAAARLDAARALQARYEATRGTGAVPGSLIDEAASQLRLAEIELAQAREALADRAVRAPFAGVVGLAEVEPGDRVTTDSVLTTLDDRRRLLVDFALPERYLARLRPGQALTVSNPAFGDRRFDGRIAQLDSRIDPATRNLRLRAEVPNAGDLLRPGMSFQVRLALPGERHAAVPELALQYGREGAHVWAVREGQARQVPVRTLRRIGDRVLVAGALRIGEPVVVEGVQRLREGRAVAPVARRGGAAAAAAAASAAALR